MPRIRVGRPELAGGLSRMRVFARANPVFALEWSSGFSRRQGSVSRERAGQAGNVAGQAWTRWPEGFGAAFFFLATRGGSAQR